MIALCPIEDISSGIRRPLKEPMRESLRSRRDCSTSSSSRRVLHMRSPEVLMFCIPCKAEQCSGTNDTHGNGVRHTYCANKE